jgi:tRNA threonylcarbamoyladenosine biosynthesis protein TsaE
VNEYNTAMGQRLYHFDFYRINKLEEVYDIGYEEYFYSGNYCFIEWPELIEEILPDHYIEINIEWDVNNDSRNISLTKKTN